MKSDVYIPPINTLRIAKAFVALAVIKHAVNSTNHKYADNSNFLLFSDYLLLDRHCACVCNCSGFCVLPNPALVYD